MKRGKRRYAALSFELDFTRNYALMVSPSILLIKCSFTRVHIDLCIVLLFIFVACAHITGSRILIMIIPSSRLPDPGECEIEGKTQRSGQGSTLVPMQ